MNASEKFPRIGVGVIIIRNDKVLLGKRKGAHGENSWSFAGGHLEWNESIESCAIRETLEETGLKITNLRVGPYTNDLFIKEVKHYVTLFVLADSNTGNPQILEPEKCVGWNWFKWSELPSPLFLPVQNLYNSGFSPFNK